MAADFQYLPPAGSPATGSVIEGGSRAIVFRDPYDAKLSGLGGYVPSAAYPDGYLGNVASRREDRFLDNLKGQLTQKQYQRGVHKGEKINAQDYFWPPELQPDRRLRAMAMGVPQPDGTIAVMREAPMGTIGEQLQAATGQMPMTPRGRLRPPPDPTTTSIDRRAELKAIHGGPYDMLAAMRPPWSP